MILANFISLTPFDLSLEYAVRKHKVPSIATTNKLDNGMEQRLGELHIQWARERALRVFAFTDAVLPGEWMGTYTETVTADLLEFAFHARRVNQICGFDSVEFPSIKCFRHNIASGDPGKWLENYSWALNALMHARTFKFGYTHADHRQTFTASTANLIPLYVIVQTDKFEEATISLFGIVHCFLSHVIPEVIKHHPNWKF